MPCSQNVCNEGRQGWLHRAAPTAGLELITAELLHGLSSCGGRPCLALATATLQKSPFLRFWRGTHLDFIHPYPQPSHLPPPHGPAVCSCTWSHCNTQSSHSSVAEALQQRGAGPHPRSSTAFLGDTGGAENTFPVSATAPAGSSTILISWLAAFK